MVHVRNLNVERMKRATPGDPLRQESRGKCLGNESLMSRGGGLRVLFGRDPSQLMAGETAITHHLQPGTSSGGNHRAGLPACLCVCVCVCVCVSERLRAGRPYNINFIGYIHVSQLTNRTLAHIRGNDSERGSLKFAAGNVNALYITAVFARLSTRRQKERKIKIIMLFFTRICRI